MKLLKILVAAAVDLLTPTTKDCPRRRFGGSASAIGDTALRYACQGGCAESVVRAEELDRALGCAADAGNASVVINFLESSYISVHIVAWDSTPLYSAARTHNTVMIRILLRKSANKNTRSLNSKALQRRDPYLRGAIRAWDDLDNKNPGDINMRTIDSLQRDIIAERNRLSSTSLVL